MIPLRDSHPSFLRPSVTYTLIGLNVLVFFFELSLGTHLRQFIVMFGFIPHRFLLQVGEGAWAASLLPMFTSMFLHGGWLHLIGNMWTLYIFGDNVEDTLGHGKYVVFYLASGLAGCLAQLLFNPGSPIPMVGASGAIAGVMGAYFSLFPHSRILTLIPILFFVVIEVPAYVFLGLWFLLQFFAGSFSILGSQSQVGVAFWAHVGGFAAGFFFLRLLMLGKARSPSQTR